MNLFQRLCRYMGNKLRFARFRQDFQDFAVLSQNSKKRFPVRWENRLPCLQDRTGNTEFDRHYIYHPAWAASALQLIQPEEHVDISSILHFCSVVSAFIPMRFYDYRPADLHLSGLASEHADLTALPFADDSIASLSCMHTVEHIGLGRYGDPLDPDGDLKAMKELKRVLAAGGSLLFVAPIGRPKLMFNGHRIYSYDQITDYFAELDLVQFSLVPDDPKSGGLIENATREMADVQSYGCGCFWFKKPLL